MKKMLNISFAYAIAAMVGGVFYREFTKFSGFTVGRTTLAFVHTHLFLLGMVMFLLAALFVTRVDVENNSKWKAFLTIYNIGVPLTTIMLVVRGVLQVLGTEMSRGMDAAISGISGLAHIATGIGIVLFFLALKSSPEKSK